MKVKMIAQPLHSLSFITILNRILWVSVLLILSLIDNHRVYGSITLITRSTTDLFNLNGVCNLYSVNIGVQSTSPITSISSPSSSITKQSITNINNNYVVKLDFSQQQYPYGQYSIPVTLLNTQGDTFTTTFQVDCIDPVTVNRNLTITPYNYVLEKDYGFPFDTLFGFFKGWPGEKYTASIPDPVFSNCYQVIAAFEPAHTNGYFFIAFKTNAKAECLPVYKQSLVFIVKDSNGTMYNMTVDSILPNSNVQPPFPDFDFITSTPLLPFYLGDKYHAQSNQYLLSQFKNVEEPFYPDIFVNTSDIYRVVKKVYGPPQSPKYLVLPNYMDRNVPYQTSWNINTIATGKIGQHNQTIVVNVSNLTSADPTITSSLLSSIKDNALFIETFNFQMDNLRDRDLPSFQLYMPKMPFSISSGTLPSMVLTYPFYFSSMKNLSDVVFGSTASYYPQAFSRFYTINYTSTTIDTEPPMLVFYSFKTIDSLNHLQITVDVIDYGGSGVSVVEIEYNGYFLLTEADLIQGSTQNGRFEKVFETSAGVDDLNQLLLPEMTFNLVDQAGNAKKLSTYDLTLSMQIIPKLYIPKVSDFTKFRFKYNVLDVTNFDQENELYFSLPEKDLFVSLALIFNDVMDSRVYNGKWNTQTQQYEIKFFVPKGTVSGNLVYAIYFKTNIISFLDLFTRYSYLSHIKIKCDYGDQIPPFVSNIVTIPISNPNQLSFGWKLTINDYPNGFKVGYVNVTSDYDFIPHQYTFTQLDRIDGDIYSSTYQILVNLPTRTNCRTQNYRISAITLVDSSNYKGISPLESNTFSPLDNIIGTSLESRLSISVPCNTPSYTTTPPLFEITSSTNSIDVGQLNRTIIFTITANDGVSNQTGLSIRHLPIVSLHTISIDNVNRGLVPVLSATSVRDYSVSNTYQYTATINVPYGFGFRNHPFLVSVFGIANNHLVFAGNITDIRISREFNRVPIIESYSNITSSGGLITLYGHQFTVNSITKPIVQIRVEGSTVPSTLDTAKILFTSSSLLVVVVGPIPTSIDISVTEVVNNVQSNWITIRTSIPPTTPPPSTPPPIPIKLCLGPEDCNGNGQCINGECFCNGYWTGPDCTSLIDPNINITIDGTRPRVYSKNSTIDLVALREINIASQILVEVPLNLTIWNVTITETPTRTKHFYSTKLFNDSTTMLNVTIETFKEPTNYTFGNDNSIMLPGNIKYSMVIDSYNFTSKLNSMQLVFSASFELNDDGNCVNGRSFGATDTSQWIRIRLNNRSLYGKFIKKAIIDSKLTVITNRLSDQELIVEIPYYQQLVNCDPDFSYLVETKEIDCTESSKKGLNANQIVGIIVSCVVVAIAIGVTGILLIRRKYRIIRIGFKVTLISIEEYNNTRMSTIKNNN